MGVLDCPIPELKGTLGHKGSFPQFGIRQCLSSCEEVPTPKPKLQGHKLSMPLRGVGRGRDGGRSAFSETPGNRIMYNTTRDVTWNGLASEGLGAGFGLKALGSVLGSTACGLSLRLEVWGSHKLSRKRFKKASAGGTWGRFANLSSQVLTFDASLCGSSGILGRPRRHS